MCKLVTLRRGDVRRTIHLDVGTASADALDRGVRIGDRRVPCRIDVEFPGTQGQPALSMAIDSHTGIPRVIDLRITSVDGGREVRTTDVRNVAIEDWIEVIVAAMSDRFFDTESGEASVMNSTEADLRAARRVVRDARRSGRRKVTPELLERVAETYAVASERPVEAVQAAFGCSYRTAARYVQKARENGHLEVRQKEGN